MKRIQSIDIVKGVVMIIMALDHVRDMIHINSINDSPTNLNTTTPILFFTRWITYLCAPTFVFLAGTSAFLSFKNKNNILKSRHFLLKRGLYLIMLEFTVVNFGLFFDPGFHTFIFEVIAAIGFGFIILSMMLKLSSKTIASIGLLIIFSHNLFPFIPFAQSSVLKTGLSLFFMPGAFPLSSHAVLVMAYPPIPWLGIMLVGYAAGSLFELPDIKRRNIFFKISSAALLLFVIIRLINFYGDSVPWTVQKSNMFNFLSFMNLTKYPPSLLFCLITLGIMFLMLAFADQAKNKLIKIISVYGKVPLFYFIVHFFMIHFILLAILLLQDFQWSQLEFASGTFGRPKGIESGLPLWAVYLIWITVVTALYKPCKWFGNYKATHKQWWLKYI